MQQPRAGFVLAQHLKGHIMVTLHTNHGDITLTLNAEKAPETVATSCNTAVTVTTTTPSSTASSTAS